MWERQEELKMENGKLKMGRRIMNWKLKIENGKWGEEWGVANVLSLTYYLLLMAAGSAVEKRFVFQNKE